MSDLSCCNGYNNNGVDSWVWIIIAIIVIIWLCGGNNNNSNIFGNSCC
ncbi:MAG: hypothetical protein IJE46_07035 [Clostridia bacterium]|nr:hypothetical protein [Clostridia bacterium]